MDREQKIIEGFLSAAGWLVDEFDVVDLLHRLVDHYVSLLGADAAGILLVNERGALAVAASSSERMHLLELFQLQSDEGPCLDCYRSGEALLVPDVSAQRERWPRFVPEVQGQGFDSVHALPLRVRGETVGAVNLFHTQSGSLSDEDLRLGQALADVATISILQQRVIERTETVAEQLQRALDSRVIIEQAKGILAERGTLDVDSAFARLRDYARSRSALLGAVARGIVDGTISSGEVIGTSSDMGRPSG